MFRRTTRAGAIAMLVACMLAAGCKSASANTDEVLSERTKKAESSEPADQQSDDDIEGGEPTEDQGASKSVIRLFDEDEVGGSEGGDIQIENASEDAVRLSIDTSECQTFEESLSASIEQLDTTCETDDDCTALALSCDLGCNKSVATYTNLGQVERLAARYAEECPVQCRGRCPPGESLVPVCRDDGQCGFRRDSSKPGDDVPTLDEPADETDEASAEESE